MRNKISFPYPFAASFQSV